MISKAQIGLIKSLDQKKYRNDYKLFFVEGIKIVNELLISEFKLHSLFALNEWVDANSDICSVYSDKINLVSPAELKQISCLSTPNQVLALFKIPESVTPDLKNSDIILCLESIRDPGNLGTIIRIADWYGIKYIFCSQDCVDVYNPKVIQSTMGSIARVMVEYVGLKDFLLSQKEYHSYATELQGKNIHKTELKYPAAVVIGNESQGISTEVSEICTEVISIPKYGGAESLNAAMASAILLDKFKLGIINNLL
jgi:TrmH family RNA methyltransferase